MRRRKKKKRRRRRIKRSKVIVYWLKPKWLPRNWPMRSKRGDWRRLRQLPTLLLLLKTMWL